MPEFDPDKYIAQKAMASTGSFDPDKYLAAKAKEEPFTFAGAKEAVGDALASGVYNAPGMGVARQIGSNVNAAANKVLDLQKAPDDRKSFDEYRQAYLSEQEAEDQRRRERSPTATTVGDVAVSASMAALPLPFGKATGLTGAALRTGSTAGLAGIDAATQGKDVDLEKAKQAATLGGGLQAGLESASGVAGLVGKTMKAAKPGLDKLSAHLENVAERRALKGAFGGRGQKQLDALSPTKQSKIAQDILNPNEFIKEPVVTFGRSNEKLGEVSAKNKDQVWDVVTAINKKVDTTTNGNSINGEELAQNILQRANKIEPLPHNLPIIEKMKENAAYFQAKKSLSLEEAQRLKNNFEYKPHTNPQMQVLGKDASNQIRTAFTEEMSKAVAKASPEDAEKWNKAYDLFGSYAEISKAGKAAKNANTKNRGVSPSDYAIGIGGVLVGSSLGNDENQTRNILLGAAAGAGNKFLRQRGPAASAVLLDKISKTLQQSPETYGRFRGLMERAARQGGPALIGTHLMIMQQSQGKGANENLRPD